MFKIDSAGNVAGLFTNGDPMHGVQPTVVSDEWLNAVQTELVNVIQAAGLVLNKADSTQVLQALRLLVPPTILNPFVTYNKAALTLDGAWHTLAVAGVPGTATWMLIGGYVKNQGSPDNQRQTLHVRPNNAGQSMLLSMTNGVNGSYEDDCAIGPCWVQCDGQHIDYEYSADITDVNLVIYGYR